MKWWRRHYMEKFVWPVVWLTIMGVALWHGTQG